MGNSGIQCLGETNEKATWKNHPKEHGNQDVSRRKQMNCDPDINQQKPQNWMY